MGTKKLLTRRYRKIISKLTKARETTIANPGAKIDNLVFKDDKEIVDLQMLMLIGIVKNVRAGKEGSLVYDPRNTFLTDIAKEILGVGRLI